MDTETSGDLPATEMTQLCCPRCGEEVMQRFYGPCASCCVQLRASQGTAGHEAREQTYEPKMNVTPNAVALKE